MFIFALVVTVSRLPAEWLAYGLAAAQTEPDNLVGVLWAVIGALCTAVVALAAYIRYLIGEIRKVEKERHDHDIAVIEKLVTVHLETKGAVEDVTEAIVALSNKQERQARVTRKNDGKT